MAENVSDHLRTMEELQNVGAVLSFTAMATLEEIKAAEKE
jgi:hypothetical protein